MPTGRFGRGRVSRTTTLVVAACCVVAVAATPAKARERGKPGWEETGPALGLLLDLADVERLGATERDAEAGAPLVRLTADWPQVESALGAFDWSSVEAAVNRTLEMGFEPVLCLTGSHPAYLPGGGLPSPEAGASMEAWLEFVRSAVREFAARVSAFEVWDRPQTAGDGGPEAADVYAFLLKKSALVVRAEARRRRAEVRVVQGALAAGSLEWQRRLWAADVAAYVDVLPVLFQTGGSPADVGATLSSLLAEAAQHPPAPVLWAYVERGPSGRPGSPLGAAVEALAGTAAVALLRPSPGDAFAGEVEWTVGLHGALSGEGFGQAPVGDLVLRDEEGRELRGARVLGHFVSDRDLSSLAVCDLSATPASGGDPATLVLGSGRIREAWFFDPVQGRRVRTATLLPKADEPPRAIRLWGRPYPVAVAFRRVLATPGFELPPEELDVRRERGLTAAEIVARFQQVQKLQDDRLDRFIAKGRVDFHFRFAQTSGSADVAIESNYFWEKGGRLEWEQTRYYINGNPVKWKKIPELPLIQPEKVVTLPLDLTLDRTYEYRLQGEDRVGERDAYVLAFEPADPNATDSLYRGRVWIDKESFVRLRVSLVQTGLEPPVIANEERDDYVPVAGPDGESYWMMASGEGQQVWTAGGRNFVVQREVRLDSFRINPSAEEFERERSAAYASHNQMLRDTDEGFRYLERAPDGSRTVKTTVDTSQIFAAGGVFKDSSISAVAPLGGVNYFDYDLRGKGIQFNAFFAGIFAFANATKPDMFGGRADGTVEATVFGLKRKDKVFVGDDEIEQQRVEFRSQNLSARVGVPIGEFFKVTWIGSVDFNSYGQDDLAQLLLAPTDLVFVPPPDHRLLSAGLQAEFNRRGYTVSATGSRSRRSEWAPWGLFDTTSGRFVDPQFRASHQSFSRWDVTGFKEWFLPRFQKVRGEINVLDGSDLDRFSRYRFSFFGSTRLSGFSGTGVRFDRGIAARAGYAFNLFEVIRFNASLESARVKNEVSGRGSQSFTGLGLSGNFVGPWKTVISVGYGRALLSDIDDLEGEQEFLLVVLKLF